MFCAVHGRDRPGEGWVMDLPRLPWRAAPVGVVLAVGVVALGV